jgi:hypothetical protein
MATLDSRARLTAFKHRQCSSNNLLRSNSSWLIQFLSRTIQQKPNARINPRRAQAFNIIEEDEHERDDVEASGSMSC